MSCKRVGRESSLKLLQQGDSVPRKGNNRFEIVRGYRHSSLHASLRKEPFAYRIAKFEWVRELGRVRPHSKPDMFLPHENNCDLVSLCERLSPVEAIPSEPWLMD